MMVLPLLALAAVAFGIGTTEFVIVGLLPEVARDLAVDPPRAGILISGYALGVVAGAPLVAIAAERWPRRTALLRLAAVVAAGNALSAVAPSYDLLMAARVMAALCHAAIFGIGSVMVADLVPREKRAQAVAFMFTGLSVANLVGVPLGTALGHAWGWRWSFAAATLVCCLALAALRAWLPHTIGTSRERGVLRGLRVLFSLKVQIALLMSTLASVSLFSVFTYIAYILRDVTGLSPADQVWALFVFGAGITIGGLIGGRLADWSLMKSLAGLFICLAATLVAFAAAARSTEATFVVLFVWGVVSFAVLPGAQVRVLDEARDLPSLASTVNQGAFNLGNAVGAWLGGQAIAAGLGLARLPLIGAALAIAALLVLAMSAALDPRRRR